MTDATFSERILRRERAIVLAGLAALTALAWAYLLTGAGTGMSTLAMTTWRFPPPAHAAMAAPWDPAYWAVMLLMWWIMMIAMMTPSAAPMVLLYARVVRHAQTKGRMALGALPTAEFMLGYLAVWLGFSMLATSAQWGLERAGLMHQMLMWSTSATLSGLLLIAAGLYQFTPAKAVCLEHCRAPATFLSRHWHDGRLGALRMGLAHGLYCLGGCWALMLLLFVGGTMNLVWIAGLTIVVLLEKLAPHGARVAQGLAVAMIAAGLWLLAS